MKKILVLVCLLSAAVGVSAQEYHCGKCKHQKAVIESPVLESIMTRTSIRQYQDRKVSCDTVEVLLRAGMAAPTAVNKQPWHFVVVTNRDLLENLGGRSKDAPLAIVVCGDTNNMLEGGGRDYWIQDCSAATENILLAAHALGLGAVWQGGYPSERRVEDIRKVLQLPENFIPLSTIAIGYPNEAPAPKDKWNPEKVTFKK